MSKSVAVIGAGPVGLAAAAHLLERGLEPTVLEAGPAVGHAIRQWSHVRLFSPWQYAVDQAALRLLEPLGWNSPDPQAYPTGGELVERYLEPLATRTVLADHIRTSARVTGVARAGFDKVKTKGRAEAPFELRYRNGAGDKTIRADAVIDASGTWFAPNPAGASGLPAIGESEATTHIAYGMPDVLGRERGRYAGKRIAVLGAGHSAVGTLIDLAVLARSAPEMTSSGSSEVTIRQNTLAAGPTTSWSSAAHWGRAWLNWWLTAPSRSRRISASRISARSRRGFASARVCHAAAARRSPTSSSSRPASAPSSASSASCDLHSTPHSNARPLSPR